MNKNETQEKKEYEVTYSLPVSLGLDFKEINNDGIIEVHKYSISSKDIGNDFDFTFWSPTYIGELFQVSQKDPTTTNNIITLKRQKIKAEAEEGNPNLVEKSEFLKMKKLNSLFWDLMVPKFKKSHESETGKRLGKEDLVNSGYKALRRTYLVWNDLIESLSACLDADSSTDQNEDYSKFLDRMYIYKNEKHVMIKHCFRIEKDTKLITFIRGLHEQLKPRDSHLESIILQNFVSTNFGNLSPDGLNQSLVSYINSLGDQGIKSPLVRALSDMRELTEDSSNYMGVFCLIVDANTYVNFDRNYPEGLERYVSNKEALEAEVRNYVFVSGKKLRKLPFTIDEFDSLQRIIPTLVQIERMAQVREFKLYFQMQYAHDHLVYKALNSKGVDSKNNYETLETLGDTVLKTLVTCNFYLNNPKKDEGWMTQEKVKVINNDYLCTRAMETPLIYFLKTRYVKSKNFVPPYKTHGSKNNGEKEQDYAENQIISGKQTADCFEALLGKEEIT